MSESRPNVVVIMTDQQKATASHLWGSTWFQTPNLERLATSGVRFEHAITPHPLCVPARVSFWTGRYPHNHGARRNETPMPAGAAHGMRLLHDAGYDCGLIGKNHCFTDPQDLALFSTYAELTHGGRVSSPPAGVARGARLPWFRPDNAIDTAHAARRAEPRNPWFTYEVTDFPSDDYGTGLVCGQTERYLDERAASPDDPFALWVSFPDPHEPWVAPREYVDRVSLDDIRIPPWESNHDALPQRTRILFEMLRVDEVPEVELRRLMAVYYGMVAAIDDAIGRIIDRLERTGLRERTIVVFCSDHGDFMGEHGMQCKGGVFYDCLTRVPLILSWPGTIAAGRTDSSMVNLIDVVPTLLHLTGIDTPEIVDGALLPTVVPEATPRTLAFSEYGTGGPPFTRADLERLDRPWGRRTLIESLRWREAEGRRKMVRGVDRKYVHDPAGDTDELYDLGDDPWELDNRIHDPRYAADVARLRLALADWSIATEDAVPVPLPELP